MRETDKDKSEKPGVVPPENLPYLVELWDGGEAQTAKILARAAKISLARAIYTAAAQEYNDGRIVLRHGSRLIADSAKP